MKQLSQDFFSQCQQLYTIQQSFLLKNIQQQSKKRDTQSQFELMRLLTQTKKHKLRLRMNTVLENKKNRYPQQSIYEHSRVKLIKQKQSNKKRNALLEQLKNQSQKLQLNQKHDRQYQYINANYLSHILQKKMIITQGPLQSTTNDLYQMIFQEKIQCVLMLCQCVESNKVRCYDYLRKQEQGNLQEIKFQSKDKIRFKVNDIVSKEIKVDNEALDSLIQKSQVFFSASNASSEKYKFVHLFYKGWPDRGIPDNFQAIFFLIQQSLKYKNLLIHCSAGLGRSGVIAVILSILSSYKSLSSDKTVKINIFKEVRRLREYRFQAVQNSQQYKFIYDFLSFYIKKKQQKQQKQDKNDKMSEI